MDALERLVAAEEIRQVLTRRTRLIDGKHWDQLVELYTEDMPSHHTGLVGGRAQVEFVAKVMEGVRTVHQVHMPEIAFTDDTTARVITPMEDLLVWEVEGVTHWVHGYGHYHQTFIKAERGWVISDHRLSRQYLQEGYGPFDPSTGPGQLTGRGAAPLERLPAEL